MTVPSSSFPADRPADTTEVVRTVQRRLQTASEWFDEAGEQLLASEMHQAHVALDAVADSLAAAARRTEQAERERDNAVKARDLERGSFGGPLYNEWSQQWVDQTCHYRNLAIALGAKPEDMLDGYDRQLCERGIADDDDYTQKNEAREAWKDAEAAEESRDAALARVRDLEQALREIRDDFGTFAGHDGARVTNAEVIVIARAALVSGAAEGNSDE